MELLELYKKVSSTVQSALREAELEIMEIDPSSLSFGNKTILNPLTEQTEAPQLKVQCGKEFQSTLPTSLRILM